MSNRIHHQAVMIGARKTLVGVMTQPAELRARRPPSLRDLEFWDHSSRWPPSDVCDPRSRARRGRISGTEVRPLRYWRQRSREDGALPLEGVLADVREVVDWLVTTRQARRIILVGLCSGADHSLVYGISDPRVCGLVLLDPSIPPTRGYYVRYFLRHLMRPQSWINIATGRGRCWKRLRKLVGIAYDEAWERHRLDLSDPSDPVLPAKRLSTVDGSWDAVPGGIHVGHTASA